MARPSGAWMQNARRLLQVLSKKLSAGQWLEKEEKDSRCQLRQACTSPQGQVSAQVPT